MTSRKLSSALLVLCLIFLANAAWAIDGYPVEVTGNYFNPRPGSTVLCAHVEQVIDPPVKFFGETPWGTSVMAGPQNTNSVGDVCIKTVWPQGVYRVEAYALFEQARAYPQVGSYSPPVAVSVFNPNNFCGAQGGGELHLQSYGVPPDVRTTLDTRDATYAFIYKEPVGSQRCTTFGAWYFDNDNPYGPVEFVSRGITDVNFGNDVDGMVPYQFVEFTGNGYFTQPLVYYMTPVHFYIYADDFPNDNFFYIAIYDFTGNLLYQSAAEDLTGEQHVFEGKNVVQPCP